MGKQTVLLKYQGDPALMGREIESAVAIKEWLTIQQNLP
jgi:hypothetical protein